MTLICVRYMSDMRKPNNLAFSPPFIDYELADCLTISVKTQ